MLLYEKLVAKQEKLSLVGLGYVGMPIAVAFAKKGIDVVGFDLNEEKINLYKSGIDPTHEVGDAVIKASTVDFTADEKRLREAKFHIADAAIKKMIEAGQTPKKSKVVIFGLTFKENCSDTRNSKVYDIVKRLREFGIQPQVVDPWAGERDAMIDYGIILTKLEDVKDVDCIIVAVAHNEFKALGLDKLKGMFKDSRDSQNVMIDVKGLYRIEDLDASGLIWWRL